MSFPYMLWFRRVAALLQRLPSATDMGATQLPVASPPDPGKPGGRSLKEGRRFARRCQSTVLEHLMAEQWLPSLITATPEEGFQLAITLSRRGVKFTQPNMDVLKELRPDYSTNADSLTAASQVVAINFQTVAAANNYWR